MSHRSLELPREGPGAISRAWAGAARRLHAISERRRNAEIAVVERLNPSVSIESIPVVILLAVLASLISGRRH